MTEREDGNRGAARVTLSRRLAAIRDRVTEAIRSWAPGERGAWCRTQRSRLRVSDGAVIWVRGPTVPWAEWGARRGYFTVGYMDGIAYLQGLPGVGV